METSHLFSVFDIFFTTSFIIIVSVVVAKIIRGISAEQRYLILGMGFFFLVTQPALHFVVPPAKEMTIRVQASSTAERTVASSKGPERVETPYDINLKANTSAKKQFEKDVPIVGSSAENARQFSLKFIFFLLYVVVAVFILAIQIRRIVAVHAYIKISERSDNRQLLSLVNTLRCEQKIKRSVGLCISTDDSTPWTWGFFRPVIVVPKAFFKWNKQKQLAALRHELVHIQRFDQPFLLAANFCCALYWLNPVVWYAYKQLQNECEKSCDDRVIGLGSGASDYAEQLLELAKTIYHNSAKPGVVLSMANASSLSQRIQSILDSNLSRKTMDKFTFSKNLLLAFGIVVPLSMVNISHAIGGERVIDVKELGKLLSPIMSPTPKYPEEAKENGTQGHVTVVYEVNSQGFVENAKVIDSHPAGVFDAAALAAAKKFAYLPVEVNGESVEVTNVKNRFVFKLGKETDELSGGELYSLADQAIASGNSNLHIKVAEKYTDVSDWDSALYHLLRAADLGEHEDIHDFNWLLATVLYQKGMYQESSDLFEKIAASSESKHAKSAKQWINYIDRALKKESYVRNTLVNKNVL